MKSVINLRTLLLMESGVVIYWLESDLSVILASNTTRCGLVASKVNVNEREISYMSL